jgi:prepilin-type N-terminal cleavage/methylation domain-containing protein
MKLRQPIATRQGFTLLELLVAISILAILAVFSWRTLDAITRTSDSLKASSEKIDGVARVFAAFEEDAQSAQSADFPAPGALRFTAPGGAVVYDVSQGQLMRQLPGTEPGLLATGVASLHADLFYKNNAVQGLQTLALAAANAGANASPSGSSSPGSAQSDAVAAALKPRVAGVRIALTLSDGSVVTRLVLMNAM